MNYFDGITLVLVLLFSLAGFYRGFIRSFTGMTVWGGSCVLSWLLCPTAAAWLVRNFAIEPYWLNPLAFLLLFLAALILLYSIGLLLRKKIPVTVHTSRINKTAGILTGFVAGLMASMILVKTGGASLSPALSGEAAASFLAVHSAGAQQWGEKQLSAVFTLPPEEKISGVQNEEASVKTSNFIPRPDLEKQMLNLVNTERSKYGLRFLQPDAALQVVAAAHAADMFSSGYFAHNSPDGTDPFMRMKKAGIKYHLAGENLAYAANLILAHEGLMRSPGHRANILKPGFGRAGIAVLDAGAGGLMFVQEFRD